jgi:inorganic pyrophosphatase
MWDRSFYMSIPAGTDLPANVNAIIEIPKGRRSKFELDKKTGLMRLDRYLYASAHYPSDYGFIPQTLAEDGDPLDILVMVNEPTFSGCLIEARVVGMFRMTDHGQPDYKVLGVPRSDPLFNDVHCLEDLPQHFLKEVEHFFVSYKQLEGTEVKAEGWAPVDAAADEVRSSVDRYMRRLAERAKSGLAI